MDFRSRPCQMTVEWCRWSCYGCNRSHWRSRCWRAAATRNLRMAPAIREWSSSGRTVAVVVAAASTGMDSWRDSLEPLWLELWLLISARREHCIITKITCWLCRCHDFGLRLPQLLVQVLKGRITVHWRRRVERWVGVKRPSARIQRVAERAFCHWQTCRRKTLIKCELNACPSN